MLVSANDFSNLKVHEELSDRSVDNVAFPRELVSRAMKSREKAAEGIQPPWSKLSGNFALRPGELVLAGGPSGHGKSAMINQWALHASATGHRTGIISLELPAEFCFDQLAGFSATNDKPPESYLREFAEWMDDRLYLYDKVDVMQPNECLQAVIGMRKFFGCELIVIDCLFMVSLADDLEAERAFSQSLAAIAKSFNVCIVLIHHFRKTQGRDGEEKLGTKNDFIGSSHLVNVASSVVIIFEDKKLTAARREGEDPDPTKPDVLLSIAKQRYHRYEGVTGYWIHNKVRLLCNSMTRQYRPIEIRQQLRERAHEDD